MNTSTRHLLETTILTTSELSARTGVPEATLQKWAQRGTVHAVKKGRTLLFDARDFEVSARPMSSGNIMSSVRSGAARRR